MRWYLKAALQRAIGALPNAHAVNEWFQTHVTRSLALDDEFVGTKLAEAREHLARYAEYGRAPLRTVVEVGTGWYPVLPVATVLAGADRVVTFDNAPLLTAEGARATLRAVADHLAHHPEAFPEARPDRLARLHAALDAPGETAAEVLASLGIVPRVGDASATDLADGTADLVMSAVVLEYIPYDALVTLLREARRLAGPDGVHSHEVDLADQFHYVDERITPFHFLRFSDRAWALVTNDIIPQTRLRHPDYLRAFEAAGLDVVDAVLTRGPAPDLARTPLAPRFRAYAPDDLRVMRSWLTARARTPASGSPGRPPQPPGSGVGRTNSLRSGNVTPS